MLRRRKLPEIAAESPASGARFVRWLRVVQDSFAWKQNRAFCDLILHARLFFTSSTLFWELWLTYQNARAEDLLKPMLKNWLCEEFTLPEKRNLAEKPEPNLPMLLLKPWSQFWELDLTKENASQKKRTLQNETACLPKLDSKTLKPISETWANLTRNYLSKRHERILKPIKFWKLPPIKNTRLCWTRKLAENQNPNLQDSKRQFVTNLILQSTRKI